MLTFFLATALLTIPLEEIAPVLPDYAHPKFSFNEQKLAYLAPDERGAYNLYVDGKCLTHTRRAIFNFYWESDNEHLLYLYDEKGDENYHLFRADLQGNNEDLTPFPDVHVDFIRVSNSYPGLALIKMNLRDPRYKDCYLLNLETKETQPLLPHVNHRTQIIAGEDLIPQVAMNFEPDGRKFLEVYEKGAWSRLCVLDDDDWYAEVLGLTPNKKKVIILSSMDQPTRSLYAIDLKTGTKELLFSHPQLDCLKAYGNLKEGKLLAVLVRDGLLEWHFFDSEFQKEIQSIEKKLQQGEILLLSRLYKDRKWLISHRQDDHPTAYYLFDRDTRELKLVLQEAPHLLAYSFGKMESFHFDASDGQDIQGYFLKPLSGEPPYPTIVQVHGGPHARDSWGFLPQSQYWASKGYATLFINYRGSSGFGKQFLMADKEEWGKRVFQDIIDGKHWAESQGWIDPHQTLIKGGSFGGYQALLGISKTPQEFVCGIAEFPITDPLAWMPKEYVIWGFTFNKLFQEAAIGAKSPLSYAHQITAPLLMMHSTNDLRVHVDQSKKMAETLQHYRIPFTYHVLPGDGHGYRDPDNRLFYFKEVESFLSTYLQVCPQPVSK